MIVSKYSKYWYLKTKPTIKSDNLLSLCSNENWITPNMCSTIYLSHNYLTLSFNAIKDNKKVREWHENDTSPSASLEEDLWTMLLFNVTLLMNNRKKKCLLENVWCNKEQYYFLSLSMKNTSSLHSIMSFNFPLSSPITLRYILLFSSKHLWYV